MNDPNQVINELTCTGTGIVGELFFGDRLKYTNTTGSGPIISLSFQKHNFAIHVLVFLWDMVVCCLASCTLVLLCAHGALLYLFVRVAILHHLRCCLQSSIRNIMLCFAYVKAS